MGKEWTIDHAEGEEAYFNYFRAMENNNPKLLKLLTALETDEKERNDVYLYKTLRYPPTSQPPEED